MREEELNKELEKKQENHAQQQLDEVYDSLYGHGKVKSDKPKTDTRQG